jgi:hypothetical protein
VNHSIRRSVAALLTTAALVAGSIVGAAPASAVEYIHGTVRNSAGTGVENVYAHLFQYDSNAASWIGYASDGTASDGQWFIPYPSDDGTYAVFFETALSGAVFSSNQGWDGSLNSDDLSPQFSVSGGTPSGASFDMTLADNAGVVRVAMRNGHTGNPMRGDATVGYGELSLSNSVTAEDGKINVAPVFDGEYAPSFDGTLEIGHIYAATYFSSTLFGQNYNGRPFNAEPLNPVTVTPGVTTDLGTVDMYRSGNATVASTVPAGDRVAITGDAKVGSLLTATTDLPGADLSYQWGTLDLFAIGQFAPTYLPTAEDLDEQLEVRVIARRAGYTSSTFTSDATKPVAKGDPNQVSVAVAGATRFGSTLKSVVSSALPESTNTFQWYRNGFPIADADGSSLLVGKADVGERISVAVRSVAPGHGEAVVPSNPVLIAKDKVRLGVKTDKKQNPKKKIAVKITVRAGVSMLPATAKVKVYFTKKKFRTARIVSGKPKIVMIPRLSKGKHTLRILYPGTADYDKKILRVRITVAKPKPKK